MCVFIRKVRCEVVNFPRRTLRKKYTALLSVPVLGMAAESPAPFMNFNGDEHG